MFRENIEDLGKPADQPFKSVHVTFSKNILGNLCYMCSESCCKIHFCF